MTGASGGHILKEKKKAGARLLLWFGNTSGVWGLAPTPRLKTR